jgi:hypothetical protein
VLRLLIWTQDVPWDDHPKLTAIVTVEQPGTLTDKIIKNKWLSFYEAAVYMASLGVLLKWPQDNNHYKCMFQNDLVKLYVEYVGENGVDAKSFTITDIKNGNSKEEEAFAVLVRCEELKDECFFSTGDHSVYQIDYENFESIYPFDIGVLQSVFNFRKAVNGLFISKSIPYTIIEKKKKDDDTPELQLLFEARPPPSPLV